MAATYPSSPPLPAMLVSSKRLAVTTQGAPVWCSHIRSAHWREQVSPRGGSQRGRGSVPQGAGHNSAGCGTQRLGHALVGTAQARGWAYKLMSTSSMQTTHHRCWASRTPSSFCTSYAPGCQRRTHLPRSPWRTRCSQRSGGACAARWWAATSCVRRRRSGAPAPTAWRPQLWRPRSWALPAKRRRQTAAGARRAATAPRHRSVRTRRSPPCCLWRGGRGHDVERGAAAGVRGHATRRGQVAARGLVLTSRRGLRREHRHSCLLLTGCVCVVRERARTRAFWSKSLHHQGRGARRVWGRSTRWAGLVSRSRGRLSFGNIRPGNWQ
jgi:hypothetical protein